MLRPISAFVLCLATIPALALAVDDKKPDDAKVLARKLLDEGAKEFGRKQAKVMAQFYTEDAEAKLVSKETGSETFKTETYRGRGEIEGFYAKIFDSESKAEARNTVEVARFLGDDLLMVSGLFEPAVGGSIQLEFVQIRQKVGKDWLIRDMQVFLKMKE